MTGVPAAFLDGLAQLQIQLEEGELDRLGTYLDLLLEANAVMNLTGIRDRDVAWNRHVLDSLSLVPVIEAAEARCVLDLGSGGGLPGLPLAVTMPAVRFLLLEATGKKARFLEETARGIGCDNVEGLDERAEVVGEPGCIHRDHYDIVVARAVGPMPVLLELAIPLVRVGGLLLAIKGERAGEELKEAARAMDVLGCSVVDRRRTTTGTIVIVEKTRETPADYPRRPGEPRRQPIGRPPRTRGKRR